MGGEGSVAKEKRALPRANLLTPKSWLYLSLYSNPSNFSLTLRFTYHEDKDGSEH